MNISIQKRNPVIRYLLLSCIVGIVTIAFWSNSKRQLSAIMTNTYIPYAHEFLTTEQEQLYTDLLRTFTTELGIQTRLLFEDDTHILHYEDTTLAFVIQPSYKKGYIIYPPLLKQTLSSAEWNTLNIQLTHILQTNDWKNTLPHFIEDVRIILSSRIT